MNAKRDVSFTALDDIRDHVYLISLGNAFLCGDPFLKKTGHFIGARLDEVKENIVSLKKQFPGRFASEVNTDDILETLRDFSRRLQEPDKEIREKCSIGELGREMETTVRSLTGAIKTIKGQVEGETSGYSKTDSAIKMFRRIGSIGSLVALLAKGLVPLLVAAVFVFSFLFITMEKEGTFLEEIVRCEDALRSQQKKLSQLVREKNDLSGKIEDLQRIDMSRQDKIVLLELGVKVQGLEKQIANLQENIHDRETRIQNNRSQIEALKEKSFFKKLLRQ